MRHILDLWRVVRADNEDEDVNAEHGGDRNETVQSQRPQRERKAPAWARDYVV